MKLISRVILLQACSLCAFVAECCTSGDVKKKREVSSPKLGPNAGAVKKDENQSSLNVPAQTYVSMGGGGIRALVTGVAFVRALMELQRTQTNTKERKRYWPADTLATNSGGTWANGFFTAYRTLDSVDYVKMLGPVITPRMVAGLYLETVDSESKVLKSDEQFAAARPWLELVREKADSKIWFGGEYMKAVKELAEKNRTNDANLVFDRPQPLIVGTAFPLSGLTQYTMWTSTIKAARQLEFRRNEDENGNWEARWAHEHEDFFSDADAEPIHEWITNYTARSSTLTKVPFLGKLTQGEVKFDDAENADGVVFQTLMRRSSMAPGQVNAFRKLSRYYDEAEVSTAKVGFGVGDGGYLDNMAILPSLKKASRQLRDKKTSLDMKHRIVSWLAPTVRFDLDIISSIKRFGNEDYFKSSDFLKELAETVPIELSALFGLGQMKDEQCWMFCEFDYSKKQVFATSDFARVAEALWNAKQTGNGTVARLTLKTVKNEFHGIEGGISADITFALMSRPGNWSREVAKGIRKAGEDGLGRLLSEEEISNVLCGENSQIEGLNTFYYLASRNPPIRCLGASASIVHWMVLNNRDAFELTG